MALSLLITVNFRKNTYRKTKGTLNKISLLDGIIETKTVSYSSSTCLQLQLIVDISILVVHNK